jgi:serine phosphatase RsbU (regulator of sigma subunit)/ligand-binding sensor domain-containing protein
MRVITKFKLVFFILPLILISFGNLDAQTYRFRNYGSENGIPNGFVYTLLQGDKGYIWVGTGSGLSGFDGFEFFNVSFPDSADGRYPTANLKDKNGSLWFGCVDGTVFYMQNDKLLPVNMQNEKMIVSILNGPDNFVYVIPQGGNIYKINPSKPEEIVIYPLDKDIVIFSACFTRSGDLLLGTQDDIKVCSLSSSSFSIIEKIEGFDYSNVQAIYRIGETDKFLVGTNGTGLYLLSLEEGKDRLSHLSDKKDIGGLTVNSIYCDPDKNYWISTNNSGIMIIRLSPDNLSIESTKIIDKSNGLPGNDVKLVVQDNEGDFWIGLSGNGLSMLNSMALSFYAPGNSPLTNNIIYTGLLGSNYFLGTPEGYFVLDQGFRKVKDFRNLLNETSHSEISAYFIENGNIWIGTRGGGVYLQTPGAGLSHYFKSGDTGADYIQDIEVDSKFVWLGTLNGVIIIDRKNGQPKATYDINNGLPHNSVSNICLAKNGQAAIATKADRLFLVDPEKGVIEGKALMRGSRMNEIVSIAQSKDGTFWAATAGNGLFKFAGDSLASINSSDMLICYSVLADSYNHLWIGHQGGFSVYNRSNGLIKTYNTDFSGGGICNPNAIMETPAGNIMIGTTEGLIFYDRSQDKSTQHAPFNKINSVKINEILHPVETSYLLPYSKVYTLTISYTGIHFQDPEKVYYETKLEGFLDEEWSRPGIERQKTYTLSYGKYRFYLRSFSDEGLSEENPVSFDLEIKKPLTRTWGFMLSMVVLIFGIIILIVRQREKSQKKIQEYLEKELAIRTSVVMQQKGEIELQNIEITDSINYAKRIQTSILPDFHKLSDTFPDSFILFRPRDIVSGDFYWFDKIDDDRFILVCADSTGHGVPGAFMSMIGSTILQDIVTRQKIYKPSEILTRLDRQIFSTLNQNIELGVSNDGMDVVVCEINVSSRHIRFASAMRPVILVMDKEPYYIKGNRSSVGGESVIEKYFDDQEYYLNPGDTLYMFSDGLPDQFGGTDGKKMKIARLKKLIEDVSNLPMSGQKEVISRFYDEWRGEHEQVDDVLLMGVRL